MMIGKLRKKLRAFLSLRSEPSLSHTLSQRTIYIVPDAQGLSFLFMLLVMLVTAINYQSSLIYLLLFSLGALFFLSIWQSFLNLQGLRITAPAELAFEAGEPLSMNIFIQLQSRLSSGLVAFWRDDITPFPIEIASCSSTNQQEMEGVNDATQDEYCVTMTGRRFSRGVYEVPAIKIQSYFPFGLLKAWTWLRFSTQVIVYPRPIKPDSSTFMAQSLDTSVGVNKGEELDDLAVYAPGDRINRVVWSKYAASDELVVRSESTHETKPHLLDWDAYKHVGKELALSHICHELLQACHRDQMIELRIGGQILGPDNTLAHHSKCLKALAEF
jgi:uncharacterized protein (DUF58 family)